MPNKTILVIEGDKGQRQLFGTFLSEYTKSFRIVINMAEDVSKAKTIYLKKAGNIIAIAFDGCMLQESSVKKTCSVLSWIDEISNHFNGQIFALYCFDFLDCKRKLADEINKKGIDINKITVCKKENLPNIIAEKLSCELAT